MSRSQVLQQLKEKLASYPEVKFEVHDSFIQISKPNDGGFPIGLHVDPEEFTVTFADWHGHFDTDCEALDFVGFGLSNSCRLKIVSRGGTPYKWVVQSCDGTEWHSEYATGSFFFKFWLPKTEIFLQNTVIATPNQSFNPDPAATV